MLSAIPHTVNAELKTNRYISSSKLGSKQHLLPRQKRLTVDPVKQLKFPQCITNATCKFQESLFTIHLATIFFLIFSSLVHSGLKSGVSYWNLRRSPCSTPAYLRAVLFKRGHGDERGQSNPDIGKEVYSHPPLVSLIKCFLLPTLCFLLICSATGQILFPDSDHPTMHLGLWSVSHN